MKKILVLLMVLALAFTVVACGGETVETTTAAPEVTTTEAPATTQAPATTTQKPATTKAPETTTEPEATTEAPVAADFNIEDYKVALSIKKPAAKVPAATYDVWDGTVATSFAGGSGTKEDPYLISNGAELAYLAKIVNTIPLVANPDALDGSMMVDKNPTEHVYYKLTNDIYLNNVSDISAWIDDPATVPDGVNVWTPIGIGGPDVVDGKTDEKSRSFGGYFDGAGFTVYGIYTTPVWQRSGLFGNAAGTPVIPADIEEGQIVEPYSGLNGMLDIGLEGLMEYSHIQNVTVSHSMISGYGYVAAVVGMYSRGAVVNCHVDESVKVVQYGCDPDAGDGIAAVCARANGWLDKCTNSGTVMTVPTLFTKEDGSYRWDYSEYNAGIISVISGVISECANFSDVYVAKYGGLIGCFFGSSSGAAWVTDCYAEGTLHDGWIGIDTSLEARKPIKIIGIFCSQAARQDSHLDNTIERCVSAGNYASDFSFEDAEKIGMVAGEHKGWTPIDKVLYVNKGFAEDMPLCSDWESKAMYLWTNVYEITAEQLAEYRATYAK